jgi:hypothetical protein
MGYHLRKINKGTYGQLSKIREELEDLEDAIDQDVFIMAFVEMSDLYGALEAYADNMGISMEDLKKMSDVTKRAFMDGSRTS